MAGLKEFAAALPVLGAVAEQVRNMIPTLEDEVVVEVEGQPGADKKQLYYLALAAANSIVRQFAALATFDPFLPPPFGMLMIEYDAADHWVRATLRYRVGTWGGVMDIGGGPTTTSSRILSTATVYKGPECDVIGAPFGFTGDFVKIGDASVPIPGIPASSKSDDAPKLPFANQYILNSCPKTPEPQPGKVDRGTEIPSPNPKPPGDNRSRGAVVTNPQVGPPGIASTSTLSTGGQLTSGLVGEGVVKTDKCCPKSMKLVSLVYAALTDPGSMGQTTFTPPKDGPAGG